MRNILWVICFLTFSGLIVSCQSGKNLYYFNDQLPSVQSLDSLLPYATHRIQCNDRLSITISSTDPNLTAYLNPFGYVQNTTNSAGSGYLVNEQGAIEFPLLGAVHVKGLTTNEAATLIKEKLSYYYKDLFVNVGLAGKVFIISGKTTTVVPVTNERLTLFEALAQAGNQDPNDLKDDAWFVREDSGKRYFTKLDLTSKAVFESPYFYLKNNDLIYIKPSKVSSLLSGSSPFKVAMTTFAAVLTLIITLRNL